MTVVSDRAGVVAKETALEDSFRHRISWSAIFVGAVVGTAAMFFLLMLGSGVGLSLVPASSVVSKGFLTLGAIYFLAAQAMGFAAGGHLAGRLIGPMAETDREEEFRAAAHGLGVWGLCVSATASLVLLSGWVTAGSSAIIGGLAPPGPNSTTPAPPAVAAYWTDVLFRPPATPMHASLDWVRYAQAGSNTATDATPPVTDDEAQTAPRAGTTTQMTPMPNASGNDSAGGRVENDGPQGTGGVESSASPAPAVPHVITIPTPQENAAASGAQTNGTPVGMLGTRNIAADKAEVGRILEAGMASGATLSEYDRNRIAELVLQDTGVSSAEAARRTENALRRIRDDEAKAAEAARKIARNASLWIAFALLFGGIVATMAAISARWEDDRITFGLPRRSEPA